MPAINHAPRFTVADAPNFTVADALRQHVPSYLKTFGRRVPPGHRKVLGLITRCQTGELGNAVYVCKSCEQQHWVGRSCGNRHCPNCQKHKTSQWLSRQTGKLLPVQHFVVTFTVPQELRPLLRANRKAGYDAIFKAGSETIRLLLKNPKYLGSDKTGFFGALHTWGRDLKDYHPHVHFVVRGGGVSNDGSGWLQTPANFLFPHAPAIALYKNLFVQQLQTAGLSADLPPGVLKKKWVVDIKPVGDGQAVLKYLAPYVHRVAISDNRIESVDENGVTYRVTPSGSRHSVQRHATGEQFVRSFAQHILPAGFQKIRYYGFMSPNCRLQLADVRWLVWLYRGWTYWLGSRYAPQEPSAPNTPVCSNCGGELELIAVIDRQGRTFFLKRCAPEQYVRPPP